jgi:hypothetical protein
MIYIRRIHEVMVCSSISQTTNLFFISVTKIIIVKLLSKARFSLFPLNSGLKLRLQICNRKM